MKEVGQEKRGEGWARARLQEEQWRVDSKDGWPAVRGAKV